MGFYWSNLARDCEWQWHRLDQLVADNSQYHVTMLCTTEFTVRMSCVWEGVYSESELTWESTWVTNCTTAPCSRQITCQHSDNDYQFPKYPWTAFPGKCKLSYSWPGRWSNTDGTDVIKTDATVYSYIAADVEVTTYDSKICKCLFCLHLSFRTQIGLVKFCPVCSRIMYSPTSYYNSKSRIFIGSI